MGKQILGGITEKWIERFLLDSANLPDDAAVREEKDPRAQKVLARYPEVFGDVQLGGWHHEPLSHGLGEIASGLRNIWDAPNLWSRNWYIYQLHHYYHEALINSRYNKTWKPEQEFDEPALDSILAEMHAERKTPPPPTSPFAAVLVYLQKTNKARHCPNPTCPAPYFIATHRGQRHCSQECAAECTREAKRKWWNDNRAKNGGIQ